MRRLATVELRDRSSTTPAGAVAAVAAAAVCIAGAHSIARQTSRAHVRAGAADRGIADVLGARVAIIARQGAGAARSSRGVASLHRTGIAVIGARDGRA